MTTFSRPTLLLALLLLSGAASRAHAATTPASPEGTLPPGLSSTQAGAFTVTVQPGDTAYSLARAHGLTVDALLDLNGLTAPNLRVGQVLRVREVPPYTVQKGDTLYSLARRFGTSVDGLLAANGLPQDTVLEVGQVLRVPGGTVPTPVARTAGGVTAGRALSTPTALPRNWRDAALALLGVPYVFGGTSLGGLDCSGFVLQVFSPMGVQLPRRSADQAQTGVPVSLNDLAPGDLVFFDTVGRGEVTHVGIYLGDNQFVNANSYKGQVAVDRLQGDPYWAPRLLSARRVLPPTVYGSGR